MENNSIQIASARPVFKSKALNTATEAIFEAVNKYNTTAAETRKTVSVVLARVERNKTYKDDGFKSLAEYAEQIGLDKSLAHKMENAGRLLDSKDEAVKEFAANTDYSKLAILASAPEGDIAAAIKSGELAADKSQREVKAWKYAHNAATAKPKVVSTWHIEGVAYGKGPNSEPFTKSIDTTVGIANPKDWAREYDNGMDCAVLTFGEAGNKVYIATGCATASVLRYTAVKVEKPKAKKSKEKLSRAELDKLIEQYKAMRAELEGDEEEEG